MKLDAVIFDMDGTITDTEKFYNRTWPLAFAACGYPDFPLLFLINKFTRQYFGLYRACLDLNKKYHLVIFGYNVDLAEP